MARARNGFLNMIRDLDRFTSSLLLAGPTLAAERIVTELQQAGPSWTGKFSNSWQITGPQGQTVRGDGAEGEPRPIRFMSAPYTGQQALRTSIRTTFTTDKIIYTISNFSPYADEATDMVQSVFLRPTPEPQTQLGKRKWESSAAGRYNPSLRWQIGTNSASETGSSRTADQDWLTRYARDGRLDRAVTIAMNAATRGIS